MPRPILFGSTSHMNAICECVKHLIMWNTVCSVEMCTNMFYTISILSFMYSIARGDLMMLI